ncbi:EcsC family protein [Defluviimonas sp. SAOS-178_SWC]|uniref:EcsC family protein n=1 Tax=Defluviimonas sp. SAOS-178_SWC TaxID=3121287 RepID=UPI0032220099
MTEVSNLPVPDPATSVAAKGSPGGVLPPEVQAEIAALARRLARANGPVMRVMNRVGGGIETRLAALPLGVRRVLDSGTAELLERAYRTAGVVGAHPRAPDVGAWGHHVAVATGGALGGFGGIGSAVIELPATVTLFFSAMQKVAGQHGFDPRADATRLTCLEIFGAGGPLADDDGVNTSFLGARMAMNGATVQAVIQKVAPALAAVLGRKLASQAVPVLGAAAGAGINLAFLGYYRDMAHVRFGLMRLERQHGAEAIETEFRAALARPVGD